MRCIECTSWEVLPDSNCSEIHHDLKLQDGLKCSGRQKMWTSEAGTPGGSQGEGKKAEGFFWFFFQLILKLTTKVRPRAWVGLILHFIGELSECAAACTQVLCKETSGDRTHLDQTSLLGTVLVWLPGHHKVAGNMKAFQKWAGVMKGLWGKAWRKRSKCGTCLPARACEEGEGY